LATIGYIILKLIPLPKALVPGLYPANLFQLTVIPFKGWGTTTSGGSVSNFVMEVDVTIYTASECQASYGSITSRMICAGIPEGGKDACQVDQYTFYDILLHLHVAFAFNIQSEETKKGN